MENSRKKQSAKDAKSLKPSAGFLLTLVAVTPWFEGCKPQPDLGSSSVLISGQDSDDGLELLTAKQNTVLKTNLLQSGSQAEGTTCPIPAGTVLTLDAIKPEGIDHWRVFRLTSVKLPTGEVGQRSVSPEPALVTTTSADAPKTPAQLLNCALLEAESFLVFSPHFTRQISTVQRVVKKSSNETAAGTLPPSDDGAWMWPTRSKRIRNDSGGSGYFNAPRASGRGHQGIDIVAAVGEPVMAARAGTIVDPAWEGAYGKVMDLKHQDGYLSRYAHLSAFSYSHGTFVEKGARIAAAGRTGNASGYGITPHLHFEIRRSDRLMNPLSLLPQ